jgi:hypothetical protein
VHSSGGAPIPLKRHDKMGKRGSLCCYSRYCVWSLTGSFSLDTQETITSSLSSFKFVCLSTAQGHNNCFSPHAWAARAVQAYETWSADRIVAVSWLRAKALPARQHFLQMAEILLRWPQSGFPRRDAGLAGGPKLRPRCWASAGHCGHSIGIGNFPIPIRRGHWRRRTPDRPIPSPQQWLERRGMLR